MGKIKDFLCRKYKEKKWRFYKLPTSEYSIETKFIDRLKELGYKYIELKNYNDLIVNFRDKLTEFNSKKLIETKGEANFSDSEFERIKIYVENNSVYESAKKLRNQFILNLDNGKTVYLDFFSYDTSRNIYQVTHQITMDKDHKDDVDYKNRYDVTILINGLPLIQIELKNPNVEISQAINQINRYRKFSFRGLFRFLQIFIVSNSYQTKYFCNENEMVNGEYRPILKSLVFFWTNDKNERINNLYDFTSDFLNKNLITEIIDKFVIIKSSEPILMVMRPYQIYAVKYAKRRVLEANQNGYIFACTGSGKTLTSFKLAQLLRDEPRIDKVIFLIDRKDLDDQTVDEYNSFEKDCVDYSNSTRVLVNQLKDTSSKLIVTTIQKMANAVKSERYAKLMDEYRDKKVVFIVDECHRSQFGKMHTDIKRHFKRANYIGFTGTPIFEANKGADGRTTADIFNAGKLDSCLHKYMIKDAIADGNVLRFSVEFQKTIIVNKNMGFNLDCKQIEDPDYCQKNNIDLPSLYHDEKRIRRVAEHIFEHHYQHTHPQGTDIYTSLFAVDSIETLGRYYDVFKELNSQRPEDKKYKIATIFSYNANEDMDEGGEHSVELLSRCIKDYNELFGTSYDVDTFDAYRKDIAKRLKQKDLPQVDILLVVNMMLTGFDSKPLNTLYLDKNLVWHNLLQAYSRTNRVDKITKQFGQIVTYRNIKKWQDEALKLFSGDGDPNEYLLESYEAYLKKWRVQGSILKNLFPNVDVVGNLKDEDEIREFIIKFRNIAHILATLKTFCDFTWDDLSSVMSEEEYEGYRSWYFYFRDITKNPSPNPPIPVPLDVDFDIELLRTDKINVAYILNLLKSAKVKTAEEKMADLDLILQEIERSDNDYFRKKKDVIIDFVKTRFYELPPEADLEIEFEDFEREQEENEIKNFAMKYGIDYDVVNDVLTEFTFKGERMSDEFIRQKLSNYKLRLPVRTELTEKIKDFVAETYIKYRVEG